ncbi:MAG: RnfABCDGE type electron transport complex subunit B [Candidatus Omnitrophota bacterium]
MDILIPVLTLTGLGLAFGAGLAIAAKRFRVVTDSRIEKVLKKLPGVNCGACGMGGCMGFAEGLVGGKCSVEQCVVAKEEARKEIAAILGVEEKERVKAAAVLHCNGGNSRVKDKFDYRGPKECIAANLLMQGPKECVYGCIGFGTCARVCPFGAITMNQECLPVVDMDKCKACNKCVLACPKKLFTLLPVKHNVFIACNCPDSARDTKAVCPVGCIACRLCEKACKHEAIHVIDNLAVIDYNKCTSCGDCVRACPVKCIVFRREGKK